MTQHSKKNHYYSIPNLDTGVDSIFLSKPVLNSLSFMENCTIGCEEIYSENKNIVVCVSGGIDSECVVEAFSKSKVPFSCCIFYYGEFNSYDTLRAEAVCQKYNKSPIRIYIDLVDFYESGKYQKWMLDNNIRCSSPQIAAHMECISKLDGTPIYSGQVPTVYNITGYEEKLQFLAAHDYGLRIYPAQKRVSPKLFYPDSHNMLSLSTDTVDFAMQRFMYSRGAGIHQFFFWSSENIGSALQATSYREILSGRTKWSYATKCKIYAELGFTGTLTQKRTGFEEVKRYYHQKNQSFDRLFRLPWIKLRPESHDGTLVDFAYFLRNGLSAQAVPIKTEK